MQKSDVIALASDHAGFELKRALLATLVEHGREVLDLGTNSGESVDYPHYAQAVVRALQEGRAQAGVLLCGTGIGTSIAANRHPGIRAALCHSVETARLAREHNNANVLVMGARVIDTQTAKACLDTFLGTEFEDGGRHARRIALLG